MSLFLYRLRVLVIQFVSLVRSSLFLYGVRYVVCLYTFWHVMISLVSLFSSFFMYGCPQFPFVISLCVSFCRVQVFLSDVVLLVRVCSFRRSFFSLGRWLFRGFYGFICVSVGFVQLVRYLFRSFVLSCLYVFSSLLRYFFLYAVRSFVPPLVLSFVRSFFLSVLFSGVLLYVRLFIFFSSFVRSVFLTLFSSFGLSFVRSFFRSLCCYASLSCCWLYGLLSFVMALVRYLFLSVIPVFIYLFIDRQLFVSFVGYIFLFCYSSFVVSFVFPLVNSLYMSLVRCLIISLLLVSSFFICYRFRYVCSSFFISSGSSLCLQLLRSFGMQFFHQLCHLSLLMVLYSAVIYFLRAFQISFFLYSCLSLCLYLVMSSACSLCVRLVCPVFLSLF